MTVFCPNCGKPNTDTATKCVSCGTELKPAASAARAGKFKGTMMMSGVQAPKPPPPGGGSAPPPPPPPAGGQPPQPQGGGPVQQGSPDAKKNMAFQATMLGPMSPPGGGAPPPGGAAPPPAQPQGGEPPSQPSSGGFGQPQGGGFGQQPQGGEQPSQPSSGGFGQQPPQGGQAGGGFGQQPQGGDQPSSGGFGQPQGGGFGGGAEASQPGGGGFGGQPPQGGGFGGQPPQGGGFGGPPGGDQPTGGGFGGPPAGGPPAGGPPPSGPTAAPQKKSKKPLIFIGIGCLLLLILSCIGGTWYACHRAQSAAEDFGTSFEAEANRIPLTFALGGIQASCNGDPSGAGTAQFFYEGNFASNQAEACNVDENVINAFSDANRSQAHMAAGSDDESFVSGLGLDATKCTVFTSGSAKIIGCSVGEDWKLVHVSNLSGVQ